MRPPLCAVCHRRLLDEGHHLVRFADYEPLPPHTVGHPRGLHWFCDEHVEAARATAGLPWAEARVRLRDGTTGSAP